MTEDVKSRLQFRKYKGAAIAHVFDDLAQMRMDVFREFPYLYDGGDLSYEMKYLQTYADSDRSMALTVYDGDKIIGATTCLPLADEIAEVREPFEKEGPEMEKVFYFGESIVLKPYRGLGLGHLFFDEREKHASSFGEYEWTSFCAVNRGNIHPYQPKDYRPNDAFWNKRGYTKVPELKTTMSWADVGENGQSDKLMEFWMRKLS
ncbi:MAG: GNAT family N-acetyltransferase [Saprospiraceae bacterium]|nr:GNAT family N-acetyltransferase [Saprospiraceae bacterium]